MMYSAVAVFTILLLSSSCHSRPSDSAEESVVSVYTTQPTTAGTAPLDVYRQIADNIAERITSPIYRFLGIGNGTSDDKPTKKTWDKIELLDEAPEEAAKTDLKPVDNDIAEDRDVEELSVEALRRVDKKPEKITLLSSYLPVNAKYVANDTSLINVVDEDDFDDDIEPIEIEAKEGPREGFVYFLEMLGSFFQLAYGAVVALFKSSSNSSQ